MFRDIASSRENNELNLTLNQESTSIKIEEKVEEKENQEDLKFKLSFGKPSGSSGLSAFQDSGQKNFLNKKKER